MPDRHRTQLTDDELLGNVPRDVLEAARRSLVYLIEGESIAYLWMRGRCVLELRRKDADIADFRTNLDAIFETLRQREERTR